MTSERVRPRLRFITTTRAPTWARGSRSSDRPASPSTAGRSASHRHSPIEIAGREFLAAHLRAAPRRWCFTTETAAKCTTPLHSAARYPTNTMATARRLFFMMAYRTGPTGWRSSMHARAWSSSFRAPRPPPPAPPRRAAPLPALAGIVTRRPPPNVLTVCTRRAGTKVRLQLRRARRPA